jgi:hypothetical protein
MDEEASSVDSKFKGKATGLFSGIEIKSMKICQLSFS